MIIPESEIDEVLTLLDPGNTGKVNSKQYIDAMYVQMHNFSHGRRAMCSYLATDIDADHVVRPHELSTLLWLTEGVEPTRARVERELKAMDTNSDGTISMVEWIKYLGNVDPVVPADHVTTRIGSRAPRISTLS